MLSKELLEELQIILKEDYGIELSSDELKHYAYAWISYAELLATIETKP